MKRRDFLGTLASLPLISMNLNLKDLAKLGSELPPAEKSPLLFVGHGNPMYAIQDNPFSRKWAELGKTLEKPKAILCISAHWLSNGTLVHVKTKPSTIHDFGGFPDELFRVQYPAPGSPEYAREVIQSVHAVTIKEDQEWGLDHGAWSVLRNMYPDAKVPVFQLSIDYGKAPLYHYELGKELAGLRQKGVLILASGNVVHNLGMVSWNDPSKTYDWAIEFDALVKQKVLENDAQALIHYQKNQHLARLAHPTNDHYLPLMYTLGLRDPKDRVEFFNEAIDMGSISMRGILLR